MPAMLNQFPTIEMPRGSDHSGMRPEQDESVRVCTVPCRISTGLFATWYMTVYMHVCSVCRSVCVYYMYTLFARWLPVINTMIIWYWRRFSDQTPVRYCIIALREVQIVRSASADKSWVSHLWCSSLFLGLLPEWPTRIPSDGRCSKKVALVPMGVGLISSSSLVYSASSPHQAQQDSTSVPQLDPQGVALSLKVEPSSWGTDTDGQPGLRHRRLEGPCLAARGSGLTYIPQCSSHKSLRPRLGGFLCILEASWGPAGRVSGFRFVLKKRSGAPCGAELPSSSSRIMVTRSGGT